MAFAQEIRDFTAAFKSVSDVLGTRDERELERLDKTSMIDYRNAQRDKWNWDMGEPERERADIISFGTSGIEPMGTMPNFTPGNLSGLKTTGSNVNMGGFTPEFSSSLAGLYSSMPEQIRNQVKVRSAYRPYSHQYDIYHRQGIRPAAQPGNSLHEYGSALDWDFGSSEAKQWVYENAGAYGFEFPLPSTDSGHMQYVKAKGRPRSKSESEAYERSLRGRVASLGTSDLPGVEPVSMVGDEAATEVNELFGGGMEKYRNAIGGMETGGEENPYGTVHDGGALGRYGVMPENLPGWSKEALGKSVSAEEFLANSDMQDKIFNYVFGNFVRQYGSPEAAALAWFTGPLNEESLSDSDGAISGNEYVQRFQQYLRGADATSPTSVTPPYDDGTPLPRPRPGGAPGVAGLPDPNIRPDLGGEAGTDTLRGSRGVDPLPQTSGHFDAVSQAGNENMNPAAAARVARGEGDNVPIRTIMKEVFGTVKKTLGTGEGAIDTGEPNPRRTAHLSGVGAAPVGLVQEMERAIDPNNELPEGLRHIRAIQKIYNYYRMAGKPEKATMSAYALSQTYKIMAGKMLGIAQASVEDNDFEGALQAFEQAYMLVPDGESLNVEPNDDGTFKVETVDDETGKVLTSRVMSARDIMSQIMQITPAEFDNLVLKPSTGVTGEGEDTAGALKSYDELMGDEAISESAPPDEVAPEAPVPPTPRPRPTSSPMGTTIPPEAAVASEGVQVASLDGTVPAAGTDEAIPETPAGAVPTAPTDVAAATGASLPSATDPRLQVNPNPRKPPPVESVDALTTKLRSAGNEAAAQLVEARYARDVKIYEEYVKNLRTAEDQNMIDAYNEFYTLLGEADENQRFDVPQELYKYITNATIQRSMQSAADAHNTIAGKLGDEADLADSAAALQELTATYIPSADFETIEGGGRAPLPETQGGIGAIIPEAFDYRTDVQGPKATPSERMQYPTEDPNVLRLNKEDRAVFDKRFEDANANIKTAGEAWDVPEPQKMDDTVALEEAFNAAGITTRESLVNSKDVKAASEGPLMYDFIANSGRMADVKSGASAILRLGGANGDPNPELAFRTALAFATPNLSNPIKSQFTARRVSPTNKMPAGTLEVVMNGYEDTPFYISEQAFLRLDNLRQEVARDYLRRLGKAGTKVATGEVNTRELGEENAIETGKRREEMETLLQDPSMEVWSGEGGGMQPLPEDR